LTRSGTTRQVALTSSVNLANSQHSTGPRTDSGKQRSSLNALRHGLTAASPVLPSEDQAAFDAHRLLANLGIQSQRLSNQFRKSLGTLQDIQADRTERQRRDRKDAAALLELHKHKGIPWEPADHGFVFSKDHVERFAQRLIRLNESRHIEHVSFHTQPPARAASAS